MTRKGVGMKCSGLTMQGLSWNAVPETSFWEIRVVELNATRVSLKAHGLTLVDVLPGRTDEDNQYASHLMHTDDSSAHARNSGGTAAFRHFSLLCNMSTILQTYSSGTSGPLGIGIFHTGPDIKGPTL